MLFGRKHPIIKVEFGLVIKSFIYGLVDPKYPDHIRYIGAATNKHRPMCHLREAHSASYSTYKLNWIRKLLSENRIYTVIILEEFFIDVSKSILTEAEKRHIKEKKQAGHCLTNATDGGDGLLNPSLETRVKLSLKASRHKHSFESKQRMSYAQKLVWQDPFRHAQRVVNLHNRLNELLEEKIIRLQRIVTYHKYREIKQLKRNRRPLLIVAARKYEQKLQGAL